MPEIINQDKAKEAAALFAANQVQSGMVVGLGTGSTSRLFIEKLGIRCRQGLKIQAVCTSFDTQSLAEKHQIPLLPIDKFLTVDLAVDGADEVDKKNRLMKGGGGALLREKIVAFHARSFLAIVDDSKCVDQLGKFPLPLEIEPFGCFAALETLTAQGLRPLMRKKLDGSVYITDNENYIVDLHLTSPLENPENLEAELKKIPGVLETGLFLNFKPQVVIGYPNGETKVRC